MPTLGELDVERRNSLVPINVAQAGHLLAPYELGSAPCGVSLLHGGHVNTNYLVRLVSGRNVVLRICQQGEAVFRKELAMLRSMKGSVPVPDVYGAGFDLERFALPYEVIEWVEGMSLTEALLQHPGDAEAIGQSVGQVLVAIGRHAAPEYSVPPLAQVIASSLFEHGGEAQLGARAAAAVWSFVSEHKAFLESFQHDASVVHGDFYGANILLRRSGRWHVAGVLDWEWAHSGCQMKDLGSLIRFDGGGASAFRHGFHSVYSEHHRLPSEWVMAARIWDLGAQCEKLAFPRHRGDVTRDAVRRIERCLVDYAG